MAISLEDRIDILESLVLSHIRATTEQSPSALKNTCNMAEAYAKTYDNEGLTDAATHLRSLLRALRIQGNLPAND